MGAPVARSGCCQNTPRSTNGGNPGNVAPLPTGATGMRLSLAVRDLVGGVRGREPGDDGRSIRSCSAGGRPARTRDGRSTPHGRPSRRTRANCALPLVAKPTQPSLVGSTDGTSTTHEIGSGSGPRPSSCDATACNWSNTIVMASRPTRRRTRPRPLRRAPCSTASAATPRPCPRPTRRCGHRSTGGPCFRPRLAIEPHQACSVNSVAGRSAHGPLRRTTRSTPPRRPATAGATSPRRTRATPRAGGGDR